MLSKKVAGWAWVSPPLGCKFHVGRDHVQLCPDPGMPSTWQKGGLGNLLLNKWGHQVAQSPEQEEVTAEPVSCCSLSGNLKQLPVSLRLHLHRSPHPMYEGKGDMCRGGRTY